MHTGLKSTQTMVTASSPVSVPFVITFGYNGLEQTSQHANSNLQSQALMMHAQQPPT